MFCVLSRSSETSCGDSRGVSSLFNLPQCLDSIESHLSLIHFSKESVTERKLILAKASLFDVEDPVMASLRKAYIMHTYGKFWRQNQRASIRHTLIAIPRGRRAGILSIWKCQRPFLRCVVCSFK